MRPPIVAADLFTTVIDGAGGRCWCTGQCGQSHRRTEGRCLRMHTGPVHLIAAPADPTISDLAAASLPATDLRAWCQGCYTAARRTALRAANERPSTDQRSLFDL